MQIGIGISLSQLKFGAAAAGTWLLDGGTWSDAGVWDDSATWDDGAVSWTDPDINNASYDSVFFSVASQELSPNSLWIKDDGLKMYVIGPNQDSVVEYSLSTAWDITTASHTASTSVNAQETTPHGFFFKSDGTKMYLTGSNGDDVNEYDLTTAWDSTTLSHVRVQSVSAQDTGPQDVWFNTDGTKMFILGYTGSDVNEYSLSTAWDVSTISYTRNFSVSGQASGPRGIFMNPDGTKMYIIDNTSDEVHEYDLTTGFDLSTASYNSVQFDVSTQDTNPFGVFFKNDGSKMYIIGGANDKVYQYSTVASAWTNPDLTTASYDSVSFSVTNEESLPRGIAFKTDGTKLYVVGLTGDDINEYNLSTAWDISTASINQTFDFSTNTTNPWGLFINEDGTKLFVVDNPNDSVDSYDFGTAWDISTLVYNTTFSVASQATTPYGLTFKPDGTKMYVSNYNTGVYEYNLSTGFDLSTASYNQFGAKDSGQTSQISGISFSPNGDKAWIVDFGNDDIDEYDLSTAWDISTLSYSKSFSVASQDTLPTFAIFKTDGSKMYVTGSATDTVYQYSTVASAWTNPDIANASYDSVSFSVATQEGNPRSVTFNSDGSKMFVLGTSSSGQVYQYSLSTSWNPSSATYDSISFGVGSQETSPISIVFKSDGSSFYIAGSNNTVYQYDLTTAYDLSTASYASKSLSTGITNTRGLSISTDGTKLWAVGSGGTIQQFTMSTAWDVSTASSDSKSLDVSARGSSTSGLYVSDDGSAVYINNLGTDTIYEYDLSTNYDISTGTYNSVSFSVASEETTPWGFTFKNDGSKMYVIGNVSDKIFQYST